MTIGDNFDTSWPDLVNRSTGRRSHNAHHPCNIGCGCIQQCSNNLTGYQPILPQELVLSIVKAGSRDEARKKIQLGQAERFDVKYSNGAWRGRKCCFDSDTRVFYVEPAGDYPYFEWPVECSNITDEDECNDRVSCKWGSVPNLIIRSGPDRGKEAPKMCRPACELADKSGNDEDGGKAGEEQCGALKTLGMQCKWGYVDGDIGTGDLETNKTQCHPDADAYEETSPGEFAVTSKIKDWSGCEPCSVTTIDALRISGGALASVQHIEPNLVNGEIVNFDVTGQRSDCSFSGGGGIHRPSFVFRDDVSDDEDDRARSVNRTNQDPVGKSSRYREAQYTFSQIAGLATLNYTLPSYDIIGDLPPGIFHNKTDKAATSFSFNSLSSPESENVVDNIATVHLPTRTLYSLKDERDLRIGCIEDGVAPRRFPNYCSVDGQKSNFDGVSGVYIKDKKETVTMSLKGWQNACEEFDPNGICTQWREEEGVVADGELLLSKCMYYNSQVGYVPATEFTPDNCPQGFETTDGVTKGYIVQAVRPTESECTAKSRCCKKPITISSPTTYETVHYDKYEKNVNYDLMTWLAWEDLESGTSCVTVACGDLTSADLCKSSDQCSYEDRGETDPSSGLGIGPQCYSLGEGGFHNTAEAFIDKYQCLAYREAVGSSSVYWTPDWEIGISDASSCCGGVALSDDSPHHIPHMDAEGDVSGLKYNQVCYSPHKEVVFQADGSCQGIKNIYDRNYYHLEATDEETGFFNLAIRGCDYYGNCVSQSVIKDCGVQEIETCGEHTVYDNGISTNPCYWKSEGSCCEEIDPSTGEGTGACLQDDDGNPRKQSECGNGPASATEKWTNFGTCEVKEHLLGRTTVLQIPTDQFASTSNFFASEVDSIGFRKGWIPRDLLVDSEANVGGGCTNVGNPPDIYDNKDSCPTGCTPSATCWKKSPDQDNPEGHAIDIDGTYFVNDGNKECTGIEEGGDYYYGCFDNLNMVPYQDHSGYRHFGVAFPGRPLDNEDFCYCLNEDVDKDFGRPGFVRQIPFLVTGTNEYRIETDGIRQIGDNKLADYPGCPSESFLSDLGLSHPNPDFCGETGGTACSVAYYPESAWGLDFVLSGGAGCKGDPDPENPTSPKGGFHELPLDGYCIEIATDATVQREEEDCLGPIYRWIEPTCPDHCDEVESGYVPADCDGSCQDGKSTTRSACEAAESIWVDTKCEGLANLGNCDLGPDADGNCWKLHDENNPFDPDPYYTCLSPNLAREVKCNVVGIYPYTNILNRSHHAVGDFRLRNLNLQPQPFKATEHKSLKYKTLAQAKFDLDQYHLCIGKTASSDNARNLAIQQVVDAEDADPGSFGFSPCHGATSYSPLSINRGLAYWFDHDFVAYLCKDSFGNTDPLVEYDPQTRRCFKMVGNEKQYDPTNWNNGSSFSPVMDHDACELLSVDISNYRIQNNIGLTDRNCTVHSVWAMEYHPDPSIGQELACFPTQNCGAEYLRTGVCPVARCKLMSGVCLPKDPDNCSDIGLGTLYKPEKELTDKKEPLERCQSECDCPDLFCEPTPTIAEIKTPLAGHCPPIEEGGDGSKCNELDLAYGDKLFINGHKEEGLSFAAIDDPDECGYCDVAAVVTEICEATQDQPNARAGQTARISIPFETYARSKCQAFFIDIGATGNQARTDCNAKTNICGLNCGQFTNGVSANTSGGMASPTDPANNNQNKCENLSGTDSDGIDYTCCVWQDHLDANGNATEPGHVGTCKPATELNCSWYDAWKSGGATYIQGATVGYTCKSRLDDSSCQEAEFLSPESLSVLYREGTVSDADTFGSLLGRDVSFITKRKEDSLKYWGETGLWPEHKSSSYEADSCRGNQLFGYVEHASLTDPVIVKSSNHKLPSYPTKLQIGYINNDPVYGNFVVNAPIFKKDWIETEFHAALESDGTGKASRIIKKEAEKYDLKKHGPDDQIWPLVECPYDYLRKGAGGCKHDDIGSFSKFLEDNPLKPLDLEHLKQNCGVDDDGNPCMGLPAGLTTVSCSSPEVILGPDILGLCYASADSGCGVEEAQGWCEDLSTGGGVDVSEEACWPPVYKWHPPQCEPSTAASLYKCVSKVPSAEYPNCDMARNQLDCGTLAASRPDIGGGLCEWIDRESACKPACSFRIDGEPMCSFATKENGDPAPAEFLVQKQVDKDHFSLFTCDGNTLESTERISQFLSNNFCPSTIFTFSGAGLKFTSCKAMNDTCCPRGCEDVTYSGPTSSDGTTLSSIKHHITGEVVAGQDDTSYNQNEFVLTNDPQVSMTCGVSIIQGGQIEILGNVPWSGTWNHYADGLIRTEDVYGIGQNKNGYFKGWTGSSLINEPPADDYYVYVEHKETCPVCCDHFLPDTISATIQSVSTSILNDLYTDDGCGFNSCDGFNAVGYHTTNQLDEYGLRISEYRLCRESDIQQEVSDAFAAINLSASLSCNAQEYSTMQECTDNNKQGFCTNTSDGSRANGIEKADCLGPVYKYVEIEGKTCKCESVPCSSDPSSTCHVAKKIYDDEISYLQQTYASLRCDAQKKFCARPSDQLRNIPHQHLSRSSHPCCLEDCIPGDTAVDDPCKKDYPTIEEWMGCHVATLYANGSHTAQNITCEIPQDVCFTDPGMDPTDVFENCGECVEGNNSPDPFACSGQSTRTDCNNAGCDWMSNAGGGDPVCDPCIGYPNNRPFACEPSCVETNITPRYCRGQKDHRCGGTEFFPNPTVAINCEQDNAGNQIKNRCDINQNVVASGLHGGIDGCPNINEMGAADDGFHCYADIYAPTVGCLGFGQSKTIDLKYTDSAWRSDWALMGAKERFEFDGQGVRKGEYVGGQNCETFRVPNVEKQYCCWSDFYKTEFEPVLVGGVSPSNIKSNQFVVNGDVFQCPPRSKVRAGNHDVVRNADCGSCPSNDYGCGLYEKSNDLPRPTSNRDGHFFRLVAQCGPEVGLFETLNGEIPPDALGEDRTYSDPRLNLEMEVIHCGVACNTSAISAAPANSQCPEVVIKYEYEDVVDDKGNKIGDAISNVVETPFLCVTREEMIESGYSCTKQSCHSIPGQHCDVRPPCTGGCQFISGRIVDDYSGHLYEYSAAAAFPMQADTHQGQNEMWNFSSSPYYPKKPTLNRRVFWAERIENDEESYDLLHIDNRESCAYGEGTTVSVGKAEKFEAETGSYNGSSIDKKSKNPYISGKTHLIDEIKDTRGASSFGIQLPAYTTIKVHDASQLITNNNAYFRQFAVYEEDYEQGDDPAEVHFIKKLQLPAPYGNYPMPMPVQSSQQVGSQAFGGGKTPGKTHVGDSFGVGFGLGVNHSRVGLIPTAHNLNLEDSINGTYYTSVVPYDPTTGIGNKHISIERIENVYDTGDNGSCLFENHVELSDPDRALTRIECTTLGGYWVPKFLGTVVHVLGHHDLLDNELITISGNRCYDAACTVNGSVISDAKDTGCYEKDGFGTVFNITEADCKKDPDLVWYSGVLDIAGVTIKANTIDKTICEVTLGGSWGPDASIESAYDYEQGCPVFCRNQAQIEAFRTEKGCLDENFCQDCEVEKTEGEEDVTHCPLCAREDSNGELFGLDGEHIVRILDTKAFVIGWEHQTDFEQDFTRLAKYNRNPLDNADRFGFNKRSAKYDPLDKKGLVEYPIQHSQNPTQLFDSDHNSMGFYSGMDGTKKVGEAFLSPFLPDVETDQLFQRELYDITKVSSAVEILSKADIGVVGYVTDKTKRFLRSTTTKIVQPNGTLDDIAIDSSSRAHSGLLGVNNLGLDEIAHCGAQHDTVVVSSTTGGGQNVLICAHASDCSVLDKGSCEESNYCVLESTSFGIDSDLNWTIEGQTLLEISAIRETDRLDEVAGRCFSKAQDENGCVADPECTYFCDKRDPTGICIQGGCLPNVTYSAVCSHREHAPSTSDDYVQFFSERTDRGNILNLEGYRKNDPEGHGGISSQVAGMPSSDIVRPRPSIGSEFTFAAKKPNMFFGTQFSGAGDFLRQSGAVPKRVFTGWVFPEDLGLEDEKIYGYWSRHVGSFNINIGVPEALPTASVSCRENNSDLPLNMTYYMLMPDETCQHFKPPKGIITSKGYDLPGGPVMVQTEPGVGTAVLKVHLHEQARTIRPETGGG